MRLESLHAKLRYNYDRWASLISKGDPSSGLSCVPEYVTDGMFSTTDMNVMRIRDNNKKNNRSLCRQWNATKSTIVNFDNLAVKKSINRMPGKALPSGTDFNIFLRYLRYELYLFRSLNSRKLLGVSASKQAGTHSQTLDPPTERDQVDYPTEREQVGYPTEREQVGQQDSEEEISQQDSNNEESRDNQHYISEDKNEEVGTTAPKDFYPPRLLAIMVIGVLSN